MFGMGWSEMMVVGIVALIVIGPKDLPGLFQQMGQFVGKARGMAREFSNAMNDAARESGVNDIKKTLTAAANPKKFGVDKIREATGITTPPPAKEPAASTLSPERQDAKDRIMAATAKAATERKAREEAAKAAPPTVTVAAKPKTAAKPRAAAKPKATATATKAAAKPKAPRKTKGDA